MRFNHSVLLLASLILAVCNVPAVAQGAYCGDFVCDAWNNETFASCPMDCGVKSTDFSPRCNNMSLYQKIQVMGNGSISTITKTTKAAFVDGSLHCRYLIASSMMTGKPDGIVVSFGDANMKVSDAAKDAPIKIRLIACPSLGLDPFTRECNTPIFLGFAQPGVTHSTFEEYLILEVHSNHGISDSWNLFPIQVKRVRNPPYISRLRAPSAPSALAHAGPASDWMRLPEKAPRPPWPTLGIIRPRDLLWPLVNRCKAASTPSTTPPCNAWQSTARHTAVIRPS